jgi:hypothetical protein
MRLLRASRLCAVGTSGIEEAEKIGVYIAPVYERTLTKLPGASSIG